MIFKVRETNLNMKFYILLLMSQIIFIIILRGSINKNYKELKTHSPLLISLSTLISQQEEKNTIQ